MINLLSVSDIYKICEEPTVLKLQVKKNLKNYKKLKLLFNGTSKSTNTETKIS